jgi:hypothetical protein
MATKLLMLLVRLPAAPPALLMAGIIGAVCALVERESEDRQEVGEERRWR